MIRRLALKPSDITALDGLAQRMIAAGLWLSAIRARDIHCDCFEITTDAISGASLSIGVLASGRYFYMDHRSSAVYLGNDLEHVLSQAGLSYAW